MWDIKENQELTWSVITIHFREMLPLALTKLLKTSHQASFRVADNLVYSATDIHKTGLRCFSWSSCLHSCRSTECRTMQWLCLWKLLLCKNQTIYQCIETVIRLDLWCELDQLKERHGQLKQKQKNRDKTMKKVGGVICLRPRFAQLLYIYTL